MARTSATRSARSAPAARRTRASTPSNAPEASENARVLPARMAIEELAHRTGLTVRNVRQLQTDGLLAGPHLEGRKGYYDARHLARLKLVRRLQLRGYSRASIVDLLRRWARGEGSLDLDGLEDAVAAPVARVARSLDARGVEARFPELVESPALRRRAIAARLVFEGADGLRSSEGELLDIGRAIVDAGLPADAVIAELEAMRADGDRIAARVVGSFQRHVLDTLQREGLPPARLAEVAAAVPALRARVVRAMTLILADALERGVAPAEHPENTRSPGTRPRATPAARGARRPKR